MWPFKRKPKEQAKRSNFRPLGVSSSSPSTPDTTTPLMMGYMMGSSGHSAPAPSHDACPHDSNPHSPSCDHGSSFDSGSSFDGGGGGSD